MSWPKIRALFDRWFPPPPPCCRYCGHEETQHDCLRMDESTPPTIAWCNRCLKSFRDEDCPGFR